MHLSTLPLSFFVATAACITCKDPSERHYADDCIRNRCLRYDEAKCIQEQWDSIFSGITDGGAAARDVIAENLRYYSQSEWWTTPGNPYFPVGTGPVSSDSIMMLKHWGLMWA